VTLLLRKILQLNLALTMNFSEQLRRARGTLKITFPVTQRGIFSQKCFRNSHVSDHKIKLENDSTVSQVPLVIGLEKSGKSI
jgi:hypothetical protein